MSILTIYKGMMGGVTCMPWVVDAAKTFTSPQGVARMAVWGFYPHAGLAFQRPGKVLYPADPNDPANAYVLPYWRVLAAVDAQRCTVYNSPAVNLVAAESSNPSVSCLVYKEAGDRSADDAYLVVAANLSDKPASATITLKPEVLGMSGSYAASRVDSQTGAVSPAGVASNVVKTSELAPWQIEGLKLTKTTNVPGKLFEKDVFEDWGRWDNKTAQTPYYPAEPVFVYRAHMTRVERVPAADVPPELSAASRRLDRSAGTVRVSRPGLRSSERGALPIRRLRQAAATANRLPQRPRRAALGNCVDRIPRELR